MIDEPALEPTSPLGPSRPLPLRILMVTDRVPGSDIGNGIRVANVIQALRRAGELEVALIDSSIAGTRLPDHAGYRTHRFRVRNPPLWAKPRRFLGLLPANIRYHHTGAVRDAIRASVGSENWDLVWCSRARVHWLTEGVVDGTRVVDLDDLNDRLLRFKIADRSAVRGALRSLPRNARDWLDAPLWSRLQRRIAAAVDHVTVCSDEDRRYLSTPNCVVVPNGYPAPAPHPADGSVPGGAAQRLLFVGAITYEPNRLGVQWFIDEVLPKIRAAVGTVQFVVVGDHDGIDMGDLRARDVTFTGWVPDVADHYRSATIAVVPLHSGGGTRVKVIEALARSVPLVSTSFGCAGHHLVEGEELLVADDAAQFAARCCELLGDVTLRERLVEAGRRRYESTLTSAATVDVVHQLAVSVASNYPRRGAAG